MICIPTLSLVGSFGLVNVSKILCRFLWFELFALVPLVFQVISAGLYPVNFYNVRHDGSHSFLLMQSRGALLNWTWLNKLMKGYLGEKKDFLLSKKEKRILRMCQVISNYYITIHI